MHIGSTAWVTFKLLGYGLQVLALSKGNLFWVLIFDNHTHVFEFVGLTASFSNGTFRLTAFSDLLAISSV